MQFETLTLVSATGLWALCHSTSVNSILVSLSVTIFIPCKFSSGLCTLRDRPAFHSYMRSTLRVFFTSVLCLFGVFTYECKHVLIYTEKTHTKVASRYERLIFFYFFFQHVNCKLHGKLHHCSICCQNTLHQLLLGNCCPIIFFVGNCSPIIFLVLLYNSISHS